MYRYAKYQGLSHEWRRLASGDNRACFAGVHAEALRNLSVRMRFSALARRISVKGIQVARPALVEHARHSIIYGNYVAMYMHDATSEVA